MSGKFLKPFGIFIAFTVLLSCGGTAKVTFRPSEAPKYPAKDPTCEIEVLDEKPSSKYVELGIINYHHEQHRMSDGELELDVALPEIKKRACQVGADAIMDVHVTDERKLEWATFHVMARAIRFEQK
jgi:hypothetical protein